MSMTLRPLGAGEVYLAITDEEAQSIKGYPTMPGTTNRLIVESIFEPVNNTPNVLVFFAQNNVQQFVPRTNIKKYNIETGELTLAWDIESQPS